MPLADLDGHVVHYQQVGQGPDIVLIHGLFCNIAFWWFRVAPALAETHRVTAFDLRGHGFSGMPPNGYRAIDQAADVLGLMDRLEISQAHLVGHSFGGAIAAATALAAPQRVTRLTLADAWLPGVQQNAMLNNVERWRRMRDQLAERGITVNEELPRVAQGFFEDLLAAQKDGGAGGFAANATGISAFTGVNAKGRKRRESRALRRWRELMQRTPAHVQFSDGAGLEADALAGLRMPVDLYYGDRSQFLESRDGLITALPHANSVQIDNAGHFFPLFRPDAFLARIGADLAAGGAAATENVISFAAGRGQ